MDKYPDYAERHTASDYTQTIMKDSELVPGRCIFSHEECYCPRCKESLPRAWEHGKAVICKSCSLHMVCYGAALFIWDAGMRTATGCIGAWSSRFKQ